MSIPDYVRFSCGNSLSEEYAGEWFETLDLFGYFERFEILADGTIWLTPTKVIPSEQTRTEVGAPELIKVELKPVRLVMQNAITLVGQYCKLMAEFSNGVLAGITDIGTVTVE